MTQPLFLSHAHCSELTLHSSLDRNWHKVLLLPLMELSLSLLTTVEDGEEFSAGMVSEASLLLLLPLLALTLTLLIEEGEELLSKVGSMMQPLFLSHLHI